MQSIGIGLWGGNGHQIGHELKDNPRLRLVAYGALSREETESMSARFPTAERCETYKDLLATAGLELVSLCSPRRSEQAEDALLALRSGISVYAEKPCAMTEADLDRILAAAAQGRAVFHEMAGTVFEQPYWAMREEIRRGAIGTVVQIFAQKSYPMHPGRPLEEEIDGGLIMQNGVHALRFVEHLTGLQAVSVHACETQLGEDRPASDLRMAASVSGHLANGGIFSTIMNYLNPRGLKRWGNEEVRVFGTAGMMESIDAGARVQIICGEESPRGVDLSAVPPSWFKLVLDHVAGVNHSPFTLEEELHPTRMVIRAKSSISPQRA